MPVGNGPKRAAGSTRSSRCVNRDDDPRRPLAARRVGSTREARRAGRYVARSATTANVPDTTAQQVVIDLAWPFVLVCRTNAAWRPSRLAGAHRPARAGATRGERLWNDHSPRNRG